MFSSGQTLTILLYALLIVSALLSFFGRRFPGSLPHVIALVVPWVFLAFVVVFGFYRLGLVRAGKYPAFSRYSFNRSLMLVVWAAPCSRAARAPFPTAGTSRGSDSLTERHQPAGPRARRRGRAAPPRAGSRYAPPRW